MLGVSSLALLSGCGWFGDSGRRRTAPSCVPAPIARSRPAARCRRPIQGSSTSRALSAADETRGQQPQIGSIVAGKGGQKAQREAVEKEAAERDAKAREARLEREAAEKEAKSKEAQARAAHRARHRTTWQAGRRRTWQSGRRDQSDTGASRASRASARAAVRSRAAVRCGTAAAINGTHGCSASRRHG